MWTLIWQIFWPPPPWPGKQPDMADEKVCDPTSASIKSGEPAYASCLEFVTRRRSPARQNRGGPG
jgi:hypothetical protein